MKAYKIRSLIYLSCFIVAAVVYYQIEQDEKLQNSQLSPQTAELQIEDESGEHGDKTEIQAVKP